MLASKPEGTRPLSGVATTALLATSDAEARRPIDDAYLTVLRDRPTTPEGPAKLYVLQLHGQNVSSIDEIFTTVSPRHLVALYLQHNVIGAIDALLVCAKTLRVLNLASNVLTALPGGSFWAAFSALSVLDVSDNYIAKWRDVAGLEAATSLELLRLAGNPIALLEASRTVIVNRLPFLRALDAYVVTDEERIQQARIMTTIYASWRAQNSRPLEFGPRFSALHASMLCRLWTPWEAKPVAVDAKVRTALCKTLSALHRQYERNRSARCSTRCLGILAIGSPVLIVQRVYRGYRARKHGLRTLRSMLAAVRRIQRNIRGWAFRRYLLRQLCLVVTNHGDEALLVSTLRKQKQRAIPKIMSVWLRRRRIYLRNKAALRIKQFLRAAVAAIQAMRARLLASPWTLAIVCTPASLPTVLAVAKIAAHREHHAWGIPGCALTSRVVATGPIVVRPSGYHFHHVFAQLQRPRHLARSPCVLTKCDDMTLLQSQLHLLRDDAEQLSALRPRESTPLHRQHIAALRHEVAQRIRLLDATLQSTIQTHAARLTCKARKRAVRIRARGVQYEARSDMVLQRLHRNPKHVTPTRRDLPPPTTYETLLTFVPTSFAMYWRMLYLLRRSHGFDDNVLCIYSQDDVRRLAAAARIQSVYRSYRTRQRTQFAAAFLQARATLCLQRWWRNTLYIYRVLAQWTHCLRTVASIDSNVLYVEERVLTLLRAPAMLEMVMSSLPTRASHHWRFKFTHKALHIPITLEESLSRLPEDEQQQYLSTFLVDNGLHRVGFPLWMPSTPFHEIVGREEKHGSKDQASHLFSIGVNEVPANDVFLKPLLSSCDPKFGRFQTCLDVVADSYALWNHSEADTVPMAWGKTCGVPMVKLEFDSVQEARHRAVVLLLKTYDARTQTYARLFTYSMLRYLWLDKPTCLRSGHVFSSHWHALRLALPSRWGTFYRESVATSRDRRGCPTAGSSHLARLARLSDQPLLDLSLVQPPPMPTDDNSNDGSSNNNNTASLSTLFPEVVPATVYISAHPPRDLQELKEQQAQGIRLETAYAEAALQSIAMEELQEKQLQVAIQHMPRPPPPMVTEVAARNRHEKLQAKMRAVEGAVALHQRDQARANQTLHRMRLTERAAEARAIDERIGHCERAAAIAAQKVAVDAALQRNAYEQQQRLLMQQQNRAVQAALSTRKKALRGFAQRFGQQAVRLTRLQAQDDRDQVRATQATLPVLLAADTKHKLAAARESEQTKRSHAFVERQKARIEQRDEIREALETQALQDDYRRQDIRERIGREKKIKAHLRDDANDKRSKHHHTLDRVSL
ncbi:hypothetical protein SPRG_04802 [Saprolegnia parasitica CBS 223.65]|uniref:Uncharacterized protein n=1 Tax=Saprolegnia parasitica (strain CBS 223.65) TaxID=695850 RepID=A0A067CJI1_SAPPC|nr:hypothetical protein SPRG_04802 [Saprolegnia parasitica CBS 223.65]KDO30899.1 hypothetical protein SPRG_04802 [Saprolegnia parasitica CBS 223.65]|eukprot:XP_012198592.1 hypothetical protein SPRG_04802 [Saprolegnia parasitica CBS 223.65]